MDTIYSTIVAGAPRADPRLLVRHQMKKTTEDHVPDEAPIPWEGRRSARVTQVSDNLGKAPVRQLAIALFFFILIG